MNDIWTRKFKWIICTSQMQQTTKANEINKAHECWLTHNLKECSLSQLLLLRFTAQTVLVGRRSRRIFRFFRCTFKSIHNAAHEDRAEKILKRSKNVNGEEQWQDADKREEDNDSKVD